MAKQSSSKGKSATSKKAKAAEEEFLTPSQKQNRSGKGRQQSGSDGGRVAGRGSNH